MTVIAPPQLPLTPLGPNFGAELHGVDLARLGDEQIQAIREALVAYKVLFLRGQDGLDDTAQIEFGRRLGEVTAGHPIHDSGDVAAEVYALESQDNGFSTYDSTPAPAVRTTAPGRRGRA